ncbi:glycerate kinase [Puia dinghuensis]|uniref:Glycerate kinase n=1 Tax=Puia dinghuensis TaxID=1792502 RepID=A0A8J2UG52_9BACT|nr:glycerate kinase [Puia dinghuensis]GGB13185.1 glycerate kinase [Puia dinghuensis]
MNILIAPNAFKNSLPADGAATAILLGLQQSRLHFTGECFPVGDGGDGTGDLLIKKLGGVVLEAPVRDPFGRERQATFGFIPASETAIIEMANASGIRLLKKTELDPLRALSTGTGDLIRAALDQNARHIIIGMGGSATVDGGAGILTALGVRFTDEAIDTSGLDPRLAATELTILCDVDNPLLGPRGAAAVFGPQKGASPHAVQQLEANLQRLADNIYKTTGKDITTIPSGGTAGGAAAGLYGVLNASLVNGIEYFLQLTGFDDALQHSDLVITGEGSIDEQTLRGKAPFGVALHAKHAGIPVIGLAGKLPQNTTRLDDYFDVLLSISRRLVPPAEAIKHTAANLTATSRALGNLLALGLVRLDQRGPLL